MPQSSRIVGVANRTVYRLINAGALRGYRIGRVIRVRRDDLESYFDSVRITPGSLDHLCGPKTTHPGEQRRPQLDGRSGYSTESE